MGSAFSDLVIADRGSYGVVHALCGDSIARGFALGVFEDAVDPGDPLYNFRSIEATLNWALQANGRSERIMWLTAFDQTSITGFINSGVILPGDTVICEDAADPGLTTLDYTTKWRSVRDAVTGLNRDFIGITSADWPGSLGSLPEHQFDRLRFIDSADSHSFNASIRAGVTRPFDRRAKLIDANLHLDTFRRAALETDGVAIVNNDGIHVNVWGQTRLAGLIAEGLDLLQYLTDLDALQDVAEAEVASLQYGSSITGARAREYVSLCFSPTFP